MQTQKQLYNNIIRHTRVLLLKLEASEAEIVKIISVLKTKEIHAAIHLAWTLVDQLEPDHPHANAAFMQARIELHAIQDEYYLLENQQLWNKMSLLTARLNDTEQSKQRLKEQLKTSGKENAALLLALRHQQQLTAHLRTQLEQSQSLIQERNPHSPYMSPSFAHNNEE